MRGKVPVEADRGNISCQVVLDSLPDQNMAATQMTVGYILSQYADTEVYLSNVPPQYFFMEIHAQLELEKFRARMLEVDLDISKRNEKMKKEGKPVYDVLRPTKVPYGIAI